MSYIEDIRIYNRYDNKFNAVSGVSNSVSHMFKRILRSKLRNPNVFIFSIYLTDDKKEHFGLSSSGRLSHGLLLSGRVRLRQLYEQF